jgi:transporter family-2 protein
MKLLPWMALAFTIGAFLPLQAGINGLLRQQVGSPVAAALISFAVGTLCLLAVLLASRQSLPLPTAQNFGPVWLLGGALGAAYVCLIVVLMPRLGAALTFGLVVAGQMTLALVLDHQGWLGNARHLVNAPRLLGMAAIVLGVVLIRRN